MAQYLDVDGHQLFAYEWDNNGEAVVLLHGGLSQTSHWDSYMLPPLENDYHVFAYDRTAHGFTADRPGSLHFDFQTREAIAYLETVVKEPAHLIGFSDGANIALMVALQRPELVKSIVSIGGNYSFAGVLPQPPFDGNVAAEDQEEYNRTSPDAPETLIVKIERMVEIWKSEPNIDKADLGKIECPVLVLVGDDDVIDHHHTVELYEALPLGQLAIVPGASHVVMKDKPGITQALIAEFLEDLSYPVTRMPIRRTNPTE